MTIRNWENSSDSQDKRSCQFFLRIENLPMTASPKDIKAFFRGLDILPGGISILGKNAFVSFERLQDMSSAMLKDGHAFYGQKLFLSIVGLKEVRKINDFHIQRSLPFLSLIGGLPKGVTEIGFESLDKHRKIRPTTLIRNGETNHSETNAAFAPKEIDSPTKGLSTACSMNQRNKYCRKRIKPTRVVKVDRMTFVPKSSL